MVDLAEGNVRPYENGPPVSVPMTTTGFDLGALKRLQIQVLRDPRPSSVNSTLLSLHLGDANRVIDVYETPDGQLVIDVGEPDPITTPIGNSPAVVVVLEASSAGDTSQLMVSARNAETMNASGTDLNVRALTNAMITIGGPTTSVTGQYGRRRTIPVHIHAALAPEPVDQVRRVVRGAKRVAGTMRGKVG